MGWELIYKGDHVADGWIEGWNGGLRAGFRVRVIVRDRFRVWLSIRV